MQITLSLLCTAALAAAHGYVETATIGGQTYQFYNPYQDPYMNPPPQRVSRAIPGNGPVEDVTSIDMQCNGYTAGGIKGSQPAPLHAEAKAGSSVNLKWTLWPDSHVGPVLTYMARCPDSGCDKWMPGTEKVWFKIQEAGREGTSNNWASVSITATTNPRIVTDCDTVCYHEGWQQWRRLHHPLMHQARVLPCPPRDHRSSLSFRIPRSSVLPRLPSAQGYWRWQHYSFEPRRVPRCLC